MSSPYLPDGRGREPSPAELATTTDPRLGIAYAVNVRSEGGGENSVAQVVMSYRLHRRGPDGAVLPTLQVEMRGRHLQGMIAEGDLVQAPGPLPPAGVIQLETVTNLTTGAPVTLAKPRTSPIALVMVLVLLAILVVFVVVIVAFVAVAS